MEYGLDCWQPENRLGRIKLSLNANGYTGPIICYSWDSNTAMDSSGWAVAKSIAKSEWVKACKIPV